MRRWLPLCFLFVLCVLLSGCAAAPNAEGIAAPTAAPVEMPKAADAGPITQTAQKVLAPYTESLERLGWQNPGCISHTIPGSLLLQMAETAQRLNVKPENGRLRFSETQSAVSVYQATGLEVTSGMETQEPGSETPMGEGSISDLSVSGGGHYERRYAYDAAENLTSGTVEIAETLDGESTGRERFSYDVSAEGLRFIDVASEMTVQEDSLVHIGTYLVTVGHIQKEKAEIIEYLTEDEGTVPSLSEDGWFSVPASAVLQARYRTE